MVKKKDIRIEPVTDPQWQRLATMLDAAVPGLLCPACRTPNFYLVSPPNSNLKTIRTLFKIGKIGLTESPDEDMFYETVAVSCTSCGYLMEFIEQGLKDRAERAGWKDPDNG